MSAAAAAEFNSPPETQAKHQQQFTPQNPSPYSTFDALSVNELSEQHQSSLPNGFTLGSAVSSRSKPRLVKKRQLGFQRGNCSTPGPPCKESGSNSNQVDYNGATATDASSNGLSAPTDGVIYEKSKNEGFVFGASKSRFESNSYAEGKHSCSSDEVGRVNDVEFVFGTRSRCGSHLNPEWKECSLDGGKCGAEEFGKSENVSSLLGSCSRRSEKSTLMSSLDMDKTQSSGMGERSSGFVFGVHLCSFDTDQNESSSGMAKSGANEFGESENYGLLFGNSNSSRRPLLNTNLENGQHAESGKSSDKVDFVFGASNCCSISNSDSKVRPSGSEGFAFHGKPGNLMQNSLFEEEKYSENVGSLASDSRGRMNFDFGKVDDLGFVFHGNQSEVRTNSYSVKNESLENAGNSVPVDNQKMKSGPQLGKFDKIFVSEASFSNFDSEKGLTSQSSGNLSFEDGGKLSIDVEVETQKAKAPDVFVFGSGSAKSSRFSETTGVADETSKVNLQNVCNDAGFAVYLGNLGFPLSSKSDVFRSSTNTSGASRASTVDILSDEMKKMTVCDCKKIGCSCHMKNSSIDANASSKPDFGFGNNKKSPCTGKSQTTSCDQMMDESLHRYGSGSAGERTEGFNFRTIKEDTLVFASGSDAPCSFVGGAQQGMPNENNQRAGSWLDKQVKLGAGESVEESRTPNGDTLYAFTVNLSPGLNKKFETSGKSRSERGKGWNNRRGKLRRAFPESRQNHLPKEDSQQNMESPGSYSPMDFSPYQDNSGAPSPSNVTSSLQGKNEDLETVSEVAFGKGDKKCRESNKEYLHSHNVRVVDSSLKESQTDFSNSNTKREESECNKQNQFCFASRERDDVETNFTFSASCTQDKLSATKRHNLKKYRMKVGHAPNTTNPSQKVDAASSSVQIPVQPRNEEENLNSKYKGNKEGDEQGSTAQIQKACQKWRIRGNQAYEKGNPSKAEEFYTKGINSVPHSGTSGCCIAPLVLCYSNRAAARMSLGRMREALGDCTQAASLDPNFHKVQIRAANCHLAMGEVEVALQYFSKCLETGPAVCLDRRIIIEAANGLQKAQKVAKCVNQCAELIQERTCNAAISALEVISGVLSISSHSDKLLEMKGEALLMLGRYEEVIRLCEQTLVFAEQNVVSVAGDNYLDIMDGPTYNKSSIRLWRWRLMAKSYFHLGRLEVALDFLEKQELLTSSEDRCGSNMQESSIPFAVTVRELLHHKNAGNEAYQSGRHTQALEHYTAAVSSSIESRPFAAICFGNRALVHQALGQISDAIADCSLAIALDRSYSKAVSRRATLHEKIRDYEQAASDLRLLISLFEKQQEEITQVRRRHCSMEEKAKKGMSFDHYLILGVKQSDTASEIKKAYRKAALRHHPDKAGQFLARSESRDGGKLWKEIADEVHKDADRLFKMIGEAYAVLSDPEKRSQYDLQEELRNEQKGRNGSKGFRGSPEFYKSPTRTSANGRYRQGYRYSYYDEW